MTRDAYFIKTDVPNGTKMFVRTPLQTKMEPDFDTGNIRFKNKKKDILLVYLIGEGTTETQESNTNYGKV